MHACAIFHARTKPGVGGVTLGTPDNQTGEPMKHYKISATLSLLALFSVPTVQAETWQLGLLMESSRSPFVTERKEISPVPMINYIGDRFSYVAGKFQYALSRSDGIQIGLVAQLRSRQFYSASLDANNSPAFAGMQDRDPAFEGGLGFSSQGAWGKLEFDSLIDVTATHEGFELSARYSYPVVAGRWTFEPTLGVQFQSADLVDYYHGVRASEAVAGRPAFEADAGTNFQASLMTGYRINPRLLAIAVIEQSKLDNSISDSPIVASDQVRKLYAGLVYSF